MRQRIRPILAFLFALLLLTGAAAQGLALCQTGEICHACDGCGIVDNCGDEPQDCEECCSVTDISPNASRKKGCDIAGLACNGNCVLDIPCYCAEIKPPQPPKEQTITPALPERKQATPFTAQHGMRAPPVFA